MPHHYFKGKGQTITVPQNTILAKAKSTVHSGHLNLYEYNQKGAQTLCRVLFFLFFCGIIVIGVETLK
jgi:hypothetical protein